LAPVLLFLLAVGVVIAQAYQVTLQWKLYDDIFRGHHNIKGKLREITEKEG
jgi:DNA-binding transcriptional regulator of glucitol operon